MFYIIIIILYYKMSIESHICFSQYQWIWTWWCFLLFIGMSKWTHALPRQRWTSNLFTNGQVLLRKLIAFTDALLREKICYYANRSCNYGKICNHYAIRSSWGNPWSLQFWFNCRKGTTYSTSDIFDPVDSDDVRCLRGVEILASMLSSVLRNISISQRSVPM